jgi:hypothetical protein
MSLMPEPNAVGTDESIFMRCDECGAVCHDGAADSAANMPHSMECPECGSGRGALYYVDAYKCGQCDTQYHARGDAVECVYCQ